MANQFGGGLLSQLGAGLGFGAVQGQSGFASQLAQQQNIMQRNDMLDALRLAVQPPPPPPPHVERQLRVDMARYDGALITDIPFDKQPGTLEEKLDRELQPWLMKAKAA